MAKILVSTGEPGYAGVILVVLQDTWSGRWGRYRNERLQVASGHHLDRSALLSHGMRPVWLCLVSVKVSSANVLISVILIQS